MNLQLIANEENQDRAQCGKNEAGGMISFVCRARKHVGNGAADDRSDDAEILSVLFHNGSEFFRRWHVRPASQQFAFPVENQNLKQS